jgi:eukaryotic-like serine/threonine-protein kinase
VGSFVFFAMAYVEGKTLSARVRERGPLAPSEAARMLREVAWALGYAHEQGVIHRDVKPDNILLEDATGRAMVADFGIAGLVKDAESWRGGEIIGTPEFMSPEQALGETIDHRSDLYSLGAVGFFALSGRLPFNGDTASAVLAQQVSQAPPPLATIAPGVPRRLGQIVDQCLAKDRQQRPQSAGHLGEQLSRNLEHRKELPVALRAFVKHDARLDGAGVLLYPFGMVIVTSTFGAYAGAGAAFLTFIGSMTLVPAAVLVYRARGLLNTGFQHADLDVAFKAEIERGREDRAFGAGHKPTIFEKIMRGTALASWTTFGVGLLSLFTTVSTDAAPVFGGMVFGFVTTVATLSSFGWLVFLQRRRDVDSEFWGKLWTGRLGKWMFRLARAVFPLKTTAAAMTHRPTELVIAMAADQLYEGLPKHVKKGLGDLPDVVSRLEADARRMRARLEELQDTDLDGPASREGGERAERVVAQLRRDRELIQNRLADTVAALETIRLSLLHLHAGKVSIRSLTTDLGRARAIAEDVDRLMEGHKEVEMVLKKPAGVTARRVDG